MRLFTFEEAEACLPRLEKIFEVAADIKGRAEEKLAKVRALEKKGEDPAQLAIERAQLEFLSKSLEEALKGVEQMGAVLKGLDPALVDFPFSLEGEQVYLCWKAGERRIAHYHGVEEGFAGRRPLPKGLQPH